MIAFSFSQRKRLDKKIPTDKNALKIGICHFLHVTLNVYDTCHSTFFTHSGGVKKLSVICTLKFVPWINFHVSLLFLEWCYSFFFN